MTYKILLLCLLIFCFPKFVYAAENEKIFVTLSKCVDGNSARFILENNEIKVRFLGIESNSVIISNPDDETNGKLVEDYVCSILTNASDIAIEYDPNSEKKDKFDRDLVWVWVDGILLQENLVKLGYSKIAYLYDDYKYNDLLVNAENYAIDNKLGIWHNEICVDTNVETELSEKKETFFSRILNFVNKILEKIINFIDDFIDKLFISRM